VTDSTNPEHGAQHRATPPAYRRAVLAILRAVASTAILVTGYYLVPFGSSTAWVAVTLLVISLVLLIGLIAVQVRLIIGSSFPYLRAIEALAISLPLFLLLFASTYFVLARLSPGSFGSQLTRTDSLYFTVTVFSTVGFGDITAKTETARLVVTGQMITDLIILGVGVKVILGAVTRGKQRQQESEDAAT
jgi:hypothetical protein